MSHKIVVIYVVQRLLWDPPSVEWLARKSALFEEDEWEWTKDESAAHGWDLGAEYAGRLAALTQFAVARGGFLAVRAAPSGRSTAEQVKATVSVRDSRQISPQDVFSDLERRGLA